MKKSASQKKASLSTAAPEAARRKFMQAALTAAATFPLSGILGRSAFAAKDAAKDAAKSAAKGATKGAAAVVALPAGEKEVLESDPVAKAIGYSKTAVGRPAKDKANHCGNCSLYSAKNEGWGTCTMLMGKGVVANAGWCRSWSKKS